MPEIIGDPRAARAVVHIVAPSMTTGARIRAALARVSERHAPTDPAWSSPSRWERERAVPQTLACVATPDDVRRARLHIVK
jgi:hypothetical protein